MPDLERESRIRHHGYGDDCPPAQTDPLRNPDGIYSGASKRVAVTDGTFAPITNMPKDTRKKGRVEHDYPNSTDLSRGRFS